MLTIVITLNSKVSKNSLRAILVYMMPNIPSVRDCWVLNISFWTLAQIVCCPEWGIQFSL